MQVTETKSEGLVREYTAKAQASEIEAKVDAKLEELRPSAQLKGFRKGKVPATLLKKMYGQSIQGEAMQELVDGAVSTHLQESGHKPANRPDVKIVNEDFKPGDDLEIAFTYELLPEIPEVMFSKVELERKVVEVDDEAVDKALANLAENATNYEDKDGAAEDKDQVVIDFVGKIGDEAFEGGAADDFPLVLGSGRFIPGFEDQLIGVKAGEEKAVNVTFPEAYGAAELAGKEAVFDVTVKAVKKPAASEIDDELAKKYGAEDLEALKTQIRGRIGEEYAAASRTLLKRRLLDALNEMVDFELPPSMVDAEAKQIAHQLWHDANPDHQGHDHDEIETTEEHVGIAKRRVKLGLLLADIGAKNSIEVGENEIGQAIAMEARKYPGREREFIEYVRNDAQLRQQIAAPLFEEKVVDYVFELATVTETTVSSDDLSAELKSLDEEEGEGQEA